MPKELKFDDAKIQPVEEARKIPNAGDVKKFVGRALEIEKEIDGLKEDLKEVYQSANDEGISKKDLKVVVKYRKKPTDVEHRQGVNELLEKLGDLPLFHFSDMK